MGDAGKADGVNNPIISGVLALVMGIVTMVRMTRGMPRKLTEAALYGSQIYCDDAVMKSEALPEPSISTAEYKNMMMRMTEVEKNLNVLASRSDKMPPEKEKILNTALSRVDFLEQELLATKKVSF